MSYSRTESRRVSMIYRISKTNLFSMKKLHLHLPRNVLPNSLEEIKMPCTLHRLAAKEKSVFPSVTFQEEIKLADPSLSILTR